MTQRQTNHSRRSVAAEHDGDQAAEAGYQTRALVRGLALLSTFSARRPELSLTELAELAGLDKATALRLLRGLEQYRFVERAAGTGHYRLGLKVVELAAVYQGAHWLVEAAKPALDQLARMSQQTSELGILDGGEIVALAVAYPPRPLRRHVTLGERFMATCTSIGKAILADLASEALADYLATYPPVAQTANTIVALDDLMAEIAAAGVRGYALDDEETLPGVSCVAAPVRDQTGRAVAAINVSGPTAEFQAERRQHYIVEVTAMAATISARLGYPGDRDERRSDRPRRINP
jgi:DNA-binding IclR family transcriptional regulator